MYEFINFSGNNILEVKKDNMVNCLQ